jgi:hypothetical protein
MFNFNPPFGDTAFFHHGYKVRKRVLLCDSYLGTISIRIWGEKDAFNRIIQIINLLLYNQ